MTSTPHGVILAINAGSSSVKFQLFYYTAALELLAKGQVTNIGSAPVFSATAENTQHTEKRALPAGFIQEDALALILEWIGKENAAWEVKAVAHRIVHGGAAFTQSVMITPAVMDEIAALIPLDPLHQPHTLAAIEIMRKIKPGLPQVACFDTAFHSGRDPLFTEYALPARMRDKGLRRYGFHGLSYEWVAHKLRQEEPRLAAGRIIVAHLGNGASVCAMRNGVSIDTSMGMTAVDGLLMGTRCGTLDPGAVIYMIRNLGLSPDEAEHILYNESGLLGVSGLASDVTLLEGSDSKEAAFALDYFSLRAAQFIGQMAVALGGVDGVVFTGGIGEHSVFVREKVLARIEFMKPFEVRVIAANEERIMAMHTVTCLETNERC